jgi:DNA-binding response OmpR family regulator
MTPPTVLIADDDRSIRTVLTQALGRSGYQVRSTSNAATLWRWVEDGEGDLVITDVVMPDENGLDLIPRIKRVRPELRVVVMSAQSTLMTAVKAAQRGAFEYLPKPFDLKELLAVVARALAAPAPAQAALAGEGAPRDRPQPGDAGDLSHHRAPDDRGPYRDDQWRERHRQGAGGPRAARLRAAARRRVRRHQHGGDPARADRERAVRP